MICSNGVFGMTMLMVLVGCNLFMLLWSLDPFES